MPTVKEHLVLLSEEEKETMLQTLRDLKLTTEDKDRGQRFMLTKNNWTKADWDKLDESCGMDKDKYLFSFLQMEAEIGEKNGTPHLQIYAETHNQTRVAFLKKLFKCWAAVAYTNGAAGYCIKNRRSGQDTPFLIKGIQKPLDHWGKGGNKRPRQSEDEKKDKKKAANARRKKYTEIVHLIDTNGLDVLKAKYPEDVVKYRLETRTGPPLCAPANRTHLFLWGVAGSGKTDYVKGYAEENNLSVYRKSHNKWWDKYTGQEIVLIDDISPVNSAFWIAYLKQWTNPYPFYAETKGGNIDIRPQKFVITSNYTLKQVWPFLSQNDEDAMLRRFDVIEFTVKLPPKPAQYVEWATDYTLKTFVEKQRGCPDRHFKDLVFPKGDAPNYWKPTEADFDKYYGLYLAMRQEALAARQQATSAAVPLLPAHRDEGEDGGSGGSEATKNGKDEVFAGSDEGDEDEDDKEEC